jgi:hypothetical protein
VVELEAAGGAHAQHLHGGRRGGAGGLLLAQTRLRHRGEVAGEVARGGVRLATHVGRGQLGELRDVTKPLDRVRVRGEHLLAA